MIISAFVSGLAALGAVQDPGLPVMESGIPVISVTQNGEQVTDGWRLVPELYPDIYDASIRDAESAEICFVSDIDEFCAMARIGEAVDFSVRYDGQLHNQRITAQRYIPAAVFDEAYQARQHGRIEVLSPPAYELVNIAIALTPAFANDNGIVVRDTPYHDHLQSYFAEFVDHPFVQSLDNMFGQNPGAYHIFKMNGFAFEFDEAGELVRSDVYERTGFAGSRSNVLMPYFEQMQAFARDTDFLAFYNSQRPVYEAQIAYMRDEVGAPRMWEWLQGQFLDVDAYDGVRVVFSPLVGHNQSVTWLESNGYRELQPHVNFPYRTITGVSDRAGELWKGLILFTEFNHGFINPEAENHAQHLPTLMTDRTFWSDDTRSARSYGTTSALFLEYLNWALPALYFMENLGDEADLPRMYETLDGIMANRGFPQYPAFRQALQTLYAERSEGETVADIYEGLILWCVNYQAEQAAN